MGYVVIIVNIIIIIGILYFINKERKDNEQNIALRIDRLKTLRIFVTIVLVLVAILGIFIGIIEFGIDDFTKGIYESLDIYIEDEIRKDSNYQYNIPDYRTEYRQSEIGQLTRWIIISIIEIPICIGVISYSISVNEKIRKTPIDDM